jgi:hypothetical protein
MFAVESSLSHPAPQVQLAGAHLVEEVVSRLPAPVLEESAALLIVGLYPLLELSLDRDSLDRDERRDDIMDVEQAGLQQLSEHKIAYLQHLALSDLSLGALGDTLDAGAGGGKYGLDPVEAVLASRKHERLWLSGERSCEPGADVHPLCSVLLPNVRAAAVWHQRRAQSVAVRTLNKMFVEMGGGGGGGGGLEKALQGLPFIPPLPGLREVQRLHENLQGQWSHDEKFRQMCRILTHDSAHLRLLGLRQIFTLLVQVGQDLRL